MFSMLFETAIILIVIKGSPTKSMIGPTNEKYFPTPLYLWLQHMAPLPLKWTASFFFFFSSPSYCCHQTQTERDYWKKKRKICLFLGRYTIPRHENTKTNTFTYILQTAAVALVALWKRKWWKWFILQKYTEKWSCLWLSCQLMVPIFFWCILGLPFFNHSYLSIYTILYQLLLWQYR